MKRARSLLLFLLTFNLMLATPSIADIVSEGDEPQETSVQPQNMEGIQLLHDVEYGRPDGHPLHVEIAMPAHSAKPTPAILYFHPGGFVEGSHKQSPIAVLAHHGYFAASVEYRFSNEAPFPAQFQDGQLAVRWLRANAAKYNVDPTRIASWGGSAGAQIAQWLAVFRKEDGFSKPTGYDGVDDSVQAVVSVCGANDYTMAHRLGITNPLHANVAQLLGGTYDQVPERYKKCSLINYIRPGDPPMFLAFGANDRVVPPMQGQEIEPLLTKANIPHQILYVKNAGHMMGPIKGMPPQDPPPLQVRAQALEFLARYLRPEGSTAIAGSGLNANASGNESGVGSQSAHPPRAAMRPTEESPNDDSSGPQNQHSDDSLGLAPGTVDTSRTYPFEIVKIPSGGLTIFGAMWKPVGNGPFPTMIYNHGSEEKVALVAGEQKGYGNIGPFYVSKGFAFVIPLRRGHYFSLNMKPVCCSEGVLMNKRVKNDIAPNADPHTKNMAWLHEQDIDNEDVAAAVAWAKQQPFVDANRMVMSGISFGGIQTTLASEKGLGVKAFIPFAPGAMSWQNVPELHDREKHAMLSAQAPIFLIQAQNDYDLGPSDFLGAVLDQKGPPNQHKIYPEFVPERGHVAGHGGFATWPAGIAIWSQDVLPFINKAISP
jgi:acetyl esterase/lipase